MTAEHKPVTQTDIERACAHLTQGHPITHYRRNPDGTYSAFNNIGQKFIVIVTPPNDLHTPQAGPTGSPAKAEKARNQTTHKKSNT